MKKIVILFGICVLFLVLNFELSAQDLSQPDTPSVKVNAVALNFEHQFVEGDLQDWNLGYLSYKREAASTTYIGRLRYANRFGIEGVLAEADLYPEFTSDSYAYINAGAALNGNDLFPKIRLGATYYQNLIPSLTGGLGIRYQHFDISDVVIYTTELHLYVKDFLFMGQGFVEIPDKKLLGTLVLTARKYLNTPKDFIELKVAAGQSPEGLRFQNDVINTFTGYLVYLGMQRRLSDRWEMLSSVKFNRSNFSSNQSRNRIGLQFGLSYRF